MVSKIVIANWKMNGSLTQIRQLMMELEQGISEHKWDTHNTIVCPPYPYASFVLGRLAELGWGLGGQDCSAHKDGAFTGEVSAVMLKDIGCSHVLIGHSERRQHHLESNGLIQQKMERAFEAGLTPVLCIGETLDENQGQQTLKVIERQLRECLPADCDKSFIIAYEPVWAIGTGKVATVGDIQLTHHHIKAFLNDHYRMALPVPVLYGGSVNAQNAAEILNIPEVGGVLVGGASLKAQDFMTILTCS